MFAWAGRIPDRLRSFPLGLLYNIPNKKCQETKKRQFFKDIRKNNLIHSVTIGYITSNVSCHVVVRKISLEYLSKGKLISILKTT